MAENNEEAPWGTTHSSETAITREGRLKDRMVWMLGIHWSAAKKGKKAFSLLKYFKIPLCNTIFYVDFLMFLI